MLLLQALGWHRGEMITLIGAGARTVLLFHLAKELRDDGAKVLLTTTKNIPKPGRPHIDRLFLVENIDEFIAASAGIGAPVVIGAGSGIDDAGQLHGLSKESLDQINQSGAFDAIVVSAVQDSEALLDLSESAESSVPTTCQLAVWVVSTSILGKPLVEPWVLGAERARNLLSASTETVIDVSVLTRLAQHPAGVLKDVPAQSRRVALIDDADAPQAGAAAKSLAKSLAEVGVATAVIMN